VVTTFFGVGGLTMDDIYSHLFYIMVGFSIGFGLAGTLFYIQTVRMNNKLLDLLEVMNNRMLYLMEAMSND